MPVTSPPPAPLPSGTSPNVAKEPGYTEACLEAPAEEFVDVVDELDRVLKCVARSTLVDGVDRWRVVAVVWFDALGNRVLLAQRSAAKRHDPLAWAACVAGTVATGESYVSALGREVLEELGVPKAEYDASLVYVGPFDSPGQLRNLAVFVVHKDVDPDTLDWDHSEAEQVAWWDLDTLKTACTTDPHRFTPGLLRLLNMAVES